MAIWALFSLALCFILIFIATIRASGPMGRALCLEVAGMTGISLIGLLVLTEQSPILADYLMVLAFIPFVGSLAFSQYISRRNAERKVE